MFSDPMDVFREMDEIFGRILARWDDDFSSAEAGFSGPVPVKHELCTGDEGDPAETSVTDTRATEPVPEIIPHPDGVTVAVELPGVTEENLNLSVRGPSLLIEAVSADTVYATRAPLPTDADPATIRHSLKNGVLEVSFGKRAAID